MKLILLRCPVCQEPLTPEETDLVYSCRNCYTPIHIGSSGPKPQPTQFAYPGESDAAATVADGTWLPFWVYQGQIAIERRVSQGGSSAAQTEGMWGPQSAPAKRLLYVPAWNLSVTQAQMLGSRLIQSQPTLRPLERPAQAQLIAAVVGPEDAEKLLEFIVLAIEARRPDMLKDLEFEMTLSKPQFWALPQSMFPGTALPAS
ncbi:MAG: hypothetical protein R3300_15120 [Candidatus Promineifilaceae bacterium]|nr:hypothetical protein [Candidatus Promineifilaceae bacterium]